MKHLIETSIQLVGYGRGPRFLTIFNVDNLDIKRKTNYVEITSAAGKKVMVLFSYKNEDDTIEDVAVELHIPVLHNEILIKEYIISELNKILNNGK